MVIQAATQELRKRVSDAVQSEVGLLALELGVKTYGPAFTVLVDRITRAATLSMELGDEAFTHVQRIIDKEKGLANKPRRKHKHV